ncbi:MAG TPA: hypothetical protein VM938_00260 [Acidimicrobiales bacterium]|nr:hypothetical protein [Acidimicrobiales bacterium]
MKRLAVVTIGAIVVTGIGPATAGIGGGENGSWCADRSSLDARVDGPADVVVVVGAGSRPDKPVKSAFACVDGNVGRRYSVDALVTTWIDTEYGRAGYSCPRQPVQAVQCRRTSFQLPAQSSNQLESADNAWTIELLGAGVAYDLDLSRSRTAAHTPGACAREVCHEPGAYGAWADTGPADAPPPDPDCGEQCVTAAERRSSESPGVGVGVEGVPAEPAPGD